MQCSELKVHQDLPCTTIQTFLISTLSWENQECFILLNVLTAIEYIRINSNVFLTQVIASFFGLFILYGFPSLCATLMIVPCSQLEKLRAALLDIRQAQDNYHHHSGRHTDISEHVFQHIQKQLNNCICHHQNILRYDHVWTCIQFESVPLFQKRI